MGVSTHLKWKRCELDMMLDAQMGTTLGRGAWQIDRPSNRSMWNFYSFQPVGQWMGYFFTDLGAEGCCCSLNALFVPDFVFGLHRCLNTGLTMQNHVVFNSIFAVPGQFRRVPCIFVQYISENVICDHIFLLWLKFSGLLTATWSTMEDNLCNTTTSISFIFSFVVIKSSFRHIMMTHI